MSEPVSRYRKLDPDKIVETVRTLQTRVERRFPASGLSNVIGELLQVAEETIARTRWIQRPHLLLRCAAGVLSLAILALATLMGVNYHQFQFSDYTNFIQALEASISSVVFIGEAILFLVTWENRIKRRRALKAIHELRALAHIIDMNQLTKDPEVIVNPGQRTKSSPKRVMTDFELSRYLDYCSEMLSLIGKVAALYVQRFDDPVALSAVDEIEDLTTGLSRKIWQKIMIIDRGGTSLPGP